MYIYRNRTKTISQTTENRSRQYLFFSFFWKIPENFISYVCILAREASLGAQPTG